MLDRPAKRRFLHLFEKEWWQALKRLLEFARSTPQEKGGVQAARRDQRG